MSEENVKPLLETSIEIIAPPADVWALASDLPRLARWSPQVVRSKVKGGGPVRDGSLLNNLNRRGVLFWPTRSKVREFRPDERIAFEVLDNKSVWSFTLEPIEGGTRVVHRREVPEGLTPLSTTLTKWMLGGQERFTAELEDGMDQTLARMKAEVEHH